jgi:AbrB family looped-hinge helix DNA binding protein
MLIELRKKSQITVPKSIIKKLNLKEGDKLEIVEKDGGIFLVPVAVYPKEYIKDLKEEISYIKEKIEKGDKENIYDDVDELIKSLGSNLDE